MSVTDTGTYAETDPDNCYTNLREVKEMLGIKQDKSYADSVIIQQIKAAKRRVDRTCHRTFLLGPQHEERFYTPANATQIMIHDLVDLEALDTDQNFDGVFEQPWVEGTDFVLTPFNNPVLGMPYTGLEIFSSWSAIRSFPTWSQRSVRVTGQFGWAEVPDDVVTATQLYASRLVKRAREAPLGVVAGVGDQIGAARVSRVDPDIVDMLADYIREEV